MNFSVRLRELPTPPPGDVLVRDLTMPRGAIGAVAALCDGYGGALQLRAVEGGAPGDFMAWVAPAFAAEIDALLSYLEKRFAVRAAGPRSFGPADFAAGTHPPARPETPDGKTAPSNP